MVCVDQIDKDIVMALIENGRISFHALARRLNLSVTSVKKRYDRLLENKVILRFTIYPS
ncbi:MAG: Lrp/AsnC family transcriptional regulator, partial [Promethearchaeota archaeon]